MSSQSDTPTIAAIATPLGQGGIGIIRISGPDSRSVGERIFRSAKAGFAGFKPFMLHHGWIMDQDEPLDEVLVSCMPGPSSYTGEDVLEINCHGGPAVVQAVLELVLQQGARLAEPGEFTLRAFLNGRIDLSQAESVAEMVAAPTRTGLRLAGAKLEGRLAALIGEIRNELAGLQARIAANVDFPDEEETAELDRGRLAQDLQAIIDRLEELAENYRRHSCWREGALVVLAGRVNVGKSSLMNALLGRNRAIVTEVPGTTRDYLEEAINLEGLPVRLVDTAGLRETLDQVERAGLDQGKSLVAESDLVCLVFDRAGGQDPEILELADELPASRTLAVANKLDLQQAQASPGAALRQRGLEVVEVSAASGQGLDELVRRIRERLVGRRAEPEAGELVPNLRQQKHIEAALAELGQMRSQLDHGVSEDFLGLHLEGAASELAGITGEISSEDVLGEVFSRFCLGK